MPFGAERTYTAKASQVQLAPFIALREGRGLFQLKGVGLTEGEVSLLVLRRSPDR